MKSEIYPSKKQRLHARSRRPQRSSPLRAPPCGLFFATDGRLSLYFSLISGERTHLNFLNFQKLTDYLHYGSAAEGKARPRPALTTSTCSVYAQAWIWNS